MEEYIGFPQSLAPNPMRNDSLMMPDRGAAGEIELKVLQRMISYRRAILHGWYTQAKRIRLEVSMGVLSSRSVCFNLAGWNKAAGCDHTCMDALSQSTHRAHLI